MLGGCGPQVRPDRPFPEEGVARRERAPAPAPGTGRELVVGELCPHVAGGRPAVAPLLLRTTQWIDAPAEVNSVVERGQTPRFAAYGVDGKIAGVFETVGLADLPLGQSVAAGTYVGASPCTSDAGPGQRTDDARCVAATGGCGMAVAELTRPDDPPETPAYATGGACVSGDSLGVDIDGDGVVEWFALSGLIDERSKAMGRVRGPAQEWSARQGTRPACAPAFSLYDVKLAPEAAPGKAADAKAAVMLDVLGVIDLDGDGRQELVLALRFPTARSLVIYAAPSSPQRLELAGEAPALHQK
jgi:hypothetical protein